MLNVPAVRRTEIKYASVDKSEAVQSFEWEDGER